MNKYIFTFIMGIVFYACQSKEKNIIKEERKIENEVYTISDVKGNWKFISYNSGWSSKLIIQHEVLIINQDSSYQYFSEDTLKRQGKIKFDYFTQFDGYRGTTLNFKNWEYEFGIHIMNRENKIYLILSDDCNDCESFSFIKIKNK
jgi:hypothetical protein